MFCRMSGGISLQRWSRGSQCGMSGPLWSGCCVSWCSRSGRDDAVGFFVVVLMLIMLFQNGVVEIKNCATGIFFSGQWPLARGYRSRVFLGPWAYNGSWTTQDLLGKRSYAKLGGTILSCFLRRVRVEKCQKAKGKEMTKEGRMTKAENGKGGKELEEPYGERQT